MTSIINKSDLIQDVASRCDYITDSDVDSAVREILALLSDNLINNSRIEIRGFGTFCLHHRDARQGRNPKTGETVLVPAKAIPHFKPGKALREGVNDKWM
ncbi:integration host factor subunit beta [Psychrobacter sp. FDAARGOS_221]|uniref:integration host factor subunit beta n=1 Tax=Psychrobacter sp. FDAARGOS_221 TaxID=1975705 RepID=UPI000BB569D0|nr:integration host factor subunit beta [Psychrobacter sp. FDAARGOS_221]PNK59950.1 integration host factor subunit beta [Psychrobacter sp. FDAARGOS_221]